MCLCRRCSQRLRGNGHYKASMLHPFQSDQLAGKLLHCGRLAMHDKHLQAGIVIEMRVAGGDDQFVMFVLQIGQLFADTVLVMVIYQGDSPHDDGIRRRCPLTNLSLIHI